MEESKPKKYGESRLNELNIPVENIKEEFPAQQRPSTFKKGLIGFYDKDSYLITNFSLMTDEMIESNFPQLFLMDKSDVEYFESTSGGRKNPEMLNNLSVFMLFKPDKKIYLRVFKPLHAGYVVDCVFKEEVLNILPLVSRQQGSSISAGKFSLVNDLCFTRSCHAFLHNGGKTMVHFQNQEGQYMQHVSHAAFYHFTSSICGINWASHKDNEVTLYARKAGMEQMGKYMHIGKKNVVFPVGLYSQNEYFEPRFANPNKEENERIAKLAAANEKRKQKLQEKKNGKKKKPERVVPEKTEPEVVSQNEEEKTSQEFQQLVEQLGKVYSVNSPRNIKKEDSNNAQNSDDVETVEEVPSESQVKSSKKKKNNKKKKKRQTASEEVAEDAVEGTMEDAKPAEDLEPDVEPVADPVPQPIMPVAVEPEVVDPVAAEPANPPPAPRDPKQESSSCSKCLRTSKKCQEAIRSANIAQSKADSFESKAKRTEEVEKKMREMEEEMRQMKLQLAASLKHSEENERLRQKISKREKIEEELRKEKKELILKNENLEMEIRDLNEKSKQLKDQIDKGKLECDDRIALIESATLEIVNE
ncbi:hypothetical protein CAEBREN_10675 [Caenorhabditis brenneri]|uniref:Uncharacterized protein n=1 Tax=Caenorhabditis brenneri TaxID=135651 RepID=G0P7A8_CAEBE|nr:hypothetical protein CAEBREN_10675 [Caenorhabditis brenneri]